MNALESLLDKNMLYLDIVSGTAGSYLNSQLKTGSMFDIIDVPMVLISRGIVDYTYYLLISRTRQFGGSNLEFILSSLVWFGLMSLYKLYSKSTTYSQIAVKFLMTFIVMLSVAKVTQWG